ncbi:hypothetical protein A3E73_00315 [Candidatus Beckwithbacteria bacterium RIFCSPHIGHO2_12_FULL_47_17]|uniref:Antitoxin n=1 Tax=Candidatus Beckwithbacteria bacterium RIFCSPHIGHO2_12_FULL_47_17 TaxID=1797460 RepID=A0A1F5DL24_9BACT|nr:MAG: hypothetical protein A3E73_00315 [Candidatus Beckwithbacteria bacterium RIFCSPHIGHO2_12_FULL_47_17]
MKKIKLDKDEQSLETALQMGEFVRSRNFASTKKMFEEAAKNYLELNKTKRITIRVNQADLIKVKARAKRNNMPYQTLLNTLIRQFAEGRAALQF